MFAELTVIKTLQCVKLKSLCCTFKHIVCQLYLNKIGKIEKINKTKSWFFAKIILVNTGHAHQEKNKESQNK